MSYIYSATGEKLCKETKVSGSNPADKLQEIYHRNLKKYGDKLGPSIEFLRQQGKSWDDIIKSASKPGGLDLEF